MLHRIMHSAAIQLAKKLPFSCEYRISISRGRRRTVRHPSGPSRLCSAPGFRDERFEQSPPTDIQYVREIGHGEERKKMEKLEDTTNTPTLVLDEMQNKMGLPSQSLRLSQAKSKPKI